MRMLLSHPHGAQVARATAETMHGFGLSRFVTGVALRRHNALTRLLRYAPSLRNRLLSPSLPVQSLWPVELAAHVAAAVLRRASPNAPRLYDCLFTAHDAMVSLLPWGACDTVYAYEDGALRTFRRAAKQGFRRIYDLPTPYFSFVEGIQRREASRWNVAARCEPQWKRKRKSEELALANEVVVASGFTQSSLRQAGYEGAIHVIPYGFPVEEFAPRSQTPSGPFTVIAVGAQSVRKGTPYLLESWRVAGLRHARLILIGKFDLPKHFLDLAGDSVIHIPYVPRSELHAWYSQADLLAFPTLADGFGLVMQEAMCVGVPVVTTECGGGPECIRHGEEGWIVDAGSIDALVETLRFACGHREELAAMGHRARVRSESYRWSHAADRIRSALLAA